MAAVSVDKAFDLALAPPSIAERRVCNYSERCSEIPTVTVYVRQYYSDPKTEIERTIERLLDDVHSDRNFGQPLRFRDVFTAIEALECVSFVYELTITPDDRQLAAYVDSDIYPEADVLCMAGEISIETVKV